MTPPIEPILRSVAVSGVTRLLAGRPATSQVSTPVSAVARRDKPATDTTSSPPGPALATPLLPPRRDADTMQRELDLARDAARQKGYDDGLAEGRSAGLAEVRAAQAEHDARLQALCERIECQAQEQLEGLAPVALQLTLTACRRILGDAMLRPEGVAALVKTAITTAQRDEVLAVRLSPRDAAWLDGHLPSSLKLIGDERLAAGDCIVEIAGGEIDARLQHQFQQLAEALAAAASAAEARP